MEKWKKIKITGGDVLIEEREGESGFVCSANPEKAELICKAPEMCALLDKIRDKLTSTAYQPTEQELQDIENDIFQIL